MRKTAAVLTAALFALTACGGGDGSQEDTTGAASSGDTASETEAKQNIKEGVLEEGGNLTQGTEVTEEQAGCLADGMVDEIGVEKLQEYGLLDENGAIDPQGDPTDLEADDADALADTLVGCVDLAEVFTSGLGDAASSLTDEQQTCITDAIDEDAISALLSAQFQGKDAPAAGDMQAALAQCLTGVSGGGMEMP